MTECQSVTDSAFSPIEQDVGGRLSAFALSLEEDGVEPARRYSGRFNVRISPELHASAAAAAAAEGKSLNQWVASALGATLP
ncbi:MAG: toxin-antitoxin system HicB family antitoxin [Gemmatimonadota bacterium]|nr:toxin-antitoxin system HicB family antitoxin [Gemmatimonadota bacterium]